MTIGVCCLLAMLIAAPGAEALDSHGSDLLISSGAALADVNQVCLRLVTVRAPYAASFENLAVEVIETLKVQGIEHIECKTGVTPRLLIHIETVSVKDSGYTVYRVQTALSRIVTLAGRRPLSVQADVWRLKPAMKAVADPELADAAAQAVVMQAEVFAAACRAAQRLRKRSTDTDQVAAPQQGADDSRPSTIPGPFVASKSSSVFHRPDCRWAQNIAEQNHMTYKTRTEATQAGKRPCKSCKP